MLTHGEGKTLRDHIDYQIANSGTINLSIPALAGEIFEGKLKKSIEGPRVVDASTETTTGTLLAGETDFVLNFVYTPNANPSQQLGDISVAVDGIETFRTEDNVAPGIGVEGEYQEVDNGAGSSVIVRFEAVGIDRNIRVHSIGALVERTNDSQQAVLESIAGQLDVIIPDLALATGNPESKYQSAPNDVNLKQFNDTVIAILTTDVPIVTNWVSFTPTWTALGTDPAIGNGTLEGKWRRVGDTAEISFHVNAGSTTTFGTGSRYQFGLPTGLVIDTTKLDDVAATETNLGIGTVRFSNQRISRIVFFTTTAVEMFFIDASGDYSTGVGPTAPSAMASGDRITGDFKVPIVGFNATQTIRDQLGL
jgi:hypothetical protein